ncbi:MAG: glycoside-pentoside-hexuronide (GPH):cation symporter [Oscillospiraceae bacterium]|nr:glycoside-pentoside-hexuronide (GPH):cation symporter [Oscillospiraceae bacterium]
METVKSERPFGMRDKVGYMFGDFANDLTFVMASMVFMKFYTDVMHVGAGVVGLIMMLAKLVDAFTDMGMGQIADHSRVHKKGKFAPWVRRMAVPVATASFLMYAVWFQDMPNGFKVFWLTFSYLLWGSFCYTGVNIPYGSMASAITSDPTERASLSNWRTIGATLGNLVIGSVLPLIIYEKNAEGNQVLNGTKTMWSGLACSLLAIVLYFACYSMTTERVTMPKQEGKFSWKEFGRVLHKNRSLISIIIVSILFVLCQTTFNTMQAYIYPNYFNNSTAMAYIFLIGGVITLVISPFTVKLVERFGKKELSVFSAILGFGATLLMTILHTHNLVVWLVLYSITWVGVSIFWLICWAMITDVIDDTEVRTGIRADGTVYSLYSFARKLGQAATSGIVGGLLSAVGYTKETGFQPSVQNGIYYINTVVPMIGFLLFGLTVLFLYPLNKKRVEKNVEILKGKELSHSED